MPRRYSRVMEHFVILGGFLFGALVGMAGALLCLALLLLALWYAGFLFLFLPVIVPLVTSVRCAEAVRREYVQSGRFPFAAMTGYLLAVLCLIGIKPYAAPVFAHFDSVLDLPTAVKVAYQVVNLYLGVFCGGLVSSEIRYRRAQGKLLFTGYPTWGYAIGGMVSLFFIPLTAISALEAGWIGVLGYSALNLFVVSLSVALVSRFVPDRDQGDREPRQTPDGAATSPVWRSVVFVLLVLVLSLGLTALIQVRSASGR